MNIYMTSGTYEFLKRIKEKYTKETMLLMQNNEGALLLHETSKKTVFSAPRSYEILKSEGTLENLGFLVLNHIPVMDDDQPVFEYRFKNEKSVMNESPSLIALRVLRPTKSNTYIILTLWKNEKSYTDWENSPESQLFLQGAKTSAQPQIFSGASYTAKYYIPSED